MNLDEFLEQIKIYFVLLGYNIHIKNNNIKIDKKENDFILSLKIEKTINDHYMFQFFKEGKIMRGIFITNIFTIELNKKTLNNILSYIIKIL